MSRKSSPKVVKAFFPEVSTAFGAVAESLGLAGPETRDVVLPVATYEGDGVKYSISLDIRELSIGVRVEIQHETLSLVAGLEALAIASGVVEARGRISESAASLGRVSKVAPSARRGGPGGAWCVRSQGGGSSS